MKKKISSVLLLLLFLSAGHELYAQRKMSIGLQGGLGGTSIYNTLSGGNEYTSEVELGIPKNYPVLSYSYNLYLSYRVNKNWGIAFEPGFVRKGYKNKVVNEENSVVSRSRINGYLQLPILAEFYIDKAIVLTVGPEFGFLLHSKMKDSVSGYADMPKGKHFDLGVQIGGYYSLMKHLDVGIKVGTSITRADKYYLINDAGEVLTGVTQRHVYANPFVRIRL